MATEKKINNLVINKVESQSVYDYMAANNLINEDELYLVEGTEGSSIVIDSELSTTSGNPVQNKVITTEIEGIKELVGDTSVSTQINEAVSSKAETSDLSAHTGNTSNPHSVTKSQVGLGNVPNVTTNDQTPTYSDTTTFATLSSGEKISVAFAKIKLAITNLINHIANVSNPHSVTKAQVGLGNVENKSSAIIRGELTKDNITTALGYIPPTTNTTYGVATSSTLGLVKSGTDITVDSNGNVSVNDNSHAHIISNVNGLQEALDSKGSASDVAALQELVGDTSVSSQIISAINSIDYPVDSINGKVGAVTLTASDVGALPSSTIIPSIDGLATETYVNNKVAGIVDSAPETLDTLNELATALGNDPNFATTVATQIGNKVDKIDGKGLSTNDYTSSEKSKLSGIEDGANKTIIDSTLSVSENAADAKATGDAIRNLNTIVGDTAVSLQISNAIADKSDVGHTHNYAGANEPGGAANKLNSAYDLSDLGTYPILLAKPFPDDDGTVHKAGNETYATCGLYHSTGTTTNEGTSMLVLGNSIVSGSNSNETGKIMLYNAKGKQFTILPLNGIDVGHTYYLPSESGTLITKQQTYTRAEVEELIATAKASVMPKIGTIALTTNWTGTASPYYQDVSYSYVTENSMVDLLPTPAQLAQWQEDGLAFTTQSGNGTVRVYVSGGKPTSTIAVQIKIQEVTQL